MSNPLTVRGTQFDTSSVVAAHIETAGMSELQAQGYITSQGLTCRVVNVDGKALMVTRDYKVTRVNFTIVDNIVTAASVG